MAPFLLIRLVFRVQEGRDGIRRNFLEKGKTAGVSQLAILSGATVLLLLRRSATLAWLLSHGNRLVVMLFAHASKNSLFRTVFDRAQLLFGTVRNAASTLHSHLGTPRMLTALTCRAVRTAKSGLFHVLVASGMFACLALGAVRDTQTTLNDTVGTTLNGTLATHSLAGATWCKFRTRRRTITVG